jgi:Ca-activated chloride channel family protein
LGITATRQIFRSVALPLVPLLLVAIAVTRPYWGSDENEVAVQGDDYMLVVDVSRSMYTRDVTPSRIDLAKRKLQDLLVEFTKAGAPHRFGVTLFAGSSYLFCPITADLAVVKQFISQIDPGMVTALGSDLEAGISTALERFDTSSSKSGRILVISDGEDDSLALQRDVILIREREIRVDVL